MKCVICKHGNTEPGHATVTLERGDTILVIRDVPAQVCTECGEYYLDAFTSAHVMALGEEAVKRRAEVEVLRYVA
jgi:YgiT-type zinc finger domain-containing protein